jgi:hypothetical protein
MTYAKYYLSVSKEEPVLKRRDRHYRVLFVELPLAPDIVSKRQTCFAFEGVGIL